jgi:hypothetical protein
MNGVKKRMDLGSWYGIWIREYHSLNSHKRKMELMGPKALRRTRHQIFMYVPPSPDISHIGENGRSWDPLRFNFFFQRPALILYLKTGPDENRGTFYQPLSREF